MMHEALFHKEIVACGKTKAFTVRKVSYNLYEAKSNVYMALLWKEGTQWKSSANFVCDETAAILGREIEQHIALHTPSLS